MTDDIKSYLYEYPYQGALWGFEIKAASKEDAEARIKALGWAKYKGESVMKVPVPTPVGRLVGWLWS